MLTLRNIGLITVIVLVTSAAVVDAFRMTNCFGNNNESLADCSVIALKIQMANFKSQRDTSSPRELRGLLAEWSETDLGISRDFLRSYSNYSFVNLDVEFRVRSEFPIVVCDQSFDNVPEPRIWNLYSRTTMHAVGYAGGKTKLITSEEYSLLRKSGTVNVAEWALGKSVEVGH